jgi:hypothetical protein
MISSSNIKLVGNWVSWLNLDLGFHGCEFGELTPV